MKLSIVIVNTNEWHVLAPCLSSLFRETTGLSFEVIVVDNASTDGSRDHLRVQFPQVRVVRNTQNLGFAASNNRGFEVAQGDYVLMLNPDTEILEGAIQATVEFLECRPSAGIAACRLIFADGSLQRSLYTFPGPWNIFCEATFLSKVFPRTKLFGNYTLTYFDYDVERQVDAVCGAYLMMRREVLTRIGTLDERFFMYTEEVDLCYRAKKGGFEVWYTPSGTVVHHWGGASASNRRVILWSTGSQMLYFQKHFARNERRLLICLKYSGILLRIPLYFAFGVLSRKKEFVTKSADYLFVARRVLQSPWKYVPSSAAASVPWPVPETRR